VNFEVLIFSDAVQCWTSRVTMVH